MFEIMSADEAIRLIRDGDVICVNSFVGIENPVELHEAIYRRYQRMQSPNHLTIVSSAGFGVWDEERNAEGYIREGAVDRLICGHFGAMPSTKKILLEDRFEAYNLPLGCISHAIRAQAGGLPGALSKVGLDIFVDPRNEGPGVNRLSIDDSFVKYVEVDGEEFLYYKIPKLTIALIKGTAADRKGNITFDDMYMSGDALSICQAVKANHGKVIVQVDRLVNVPSRPRNAIIPGCLVDAIVVVEPEQKDESLVALTGSFEIPFEDWKTWNDKIDAASLGRGKNDVIGNIIGRRAASELRLDDIVNIGIGMPIWKFYKGHESDFFDDLNKMSFGQPDFIDGIEGLKPTTYDSPKDSDWVNKFIIWSAIGYNRKIAPIQMLTFYNAIANDGKMVKPTLKTGEIEIINPQIASKDNIKKMQVILEHVVSQGLGRKAGVPYMKVAGKTGTSQVGEYDFGEENYVSEYQLAFCGYLPANKPKYSMIVSMNKLGLPASGGGMAGALFHDIVEWMIAAIGQRSQVTLR